MTSEAVRSDHFPVSAAAENSYSSNSPPPSYLSVSPSASGRVGLLPFARLAGTIDSSRLHKLAAWFPQLREIKVVLLVLFKIRMHIGWNQTHPAF